MMQLFTISDEVESSREERNEKTSQGNLNRGVGGQTPTSYASLSPRKVEIGRLFRKS
jgi:hypothetical protein